MFINFAKSSRDEELSDEDEFDEDDEKMSNDDVENSEADDPAKSKLDDEAADDMCQKAEPATVATTTTTITTTTINTSTCGLDCSNMNDTPTFESIKNHFNSLKKSRHIRKTSSAKSQDFKKCQKTRMSQKSRSSSKRRRTAHGEPVGIANLAYEIEFKNSDECELPIQESSQDLTTSINEDGEYFSKC